MTYHYSLLRYVPDPARGEFVNLGILAGDDETQDWELRLIQNLRRARAFDDKGSLGLALAFAADLEDHIVAVEQLSGTSEAEPMSLQLVSQFSEEMQNIVQLSPPAPVIAESAESALDVLFSEFVVDPAAQRFRFRKKHQAVVSARRAYKQHEVPEEAVIEHAPVAAGPYTGKFDFAVANGRLVQLVHCWSFQLPNQVELAEQVKAWAWVVRELRDRGGRLETSDRAIEAGREVEVATVFIPPEGDQEDTAFVQARAAFEETGVTQLTPDDADQLGARAAELLHVTA
jgi:hypothetical protein